VLSQGPSKTISIKGTAIFGQSLLILYKLTQFSFEELKAEIWVANMHYWKNRPLPSISNTFVLCNQLVIITKSFYVLWQRIDKYLSEFMFLSFQ